MEQSAREQTLASATSRPEAAQRRAEGRGPRRPTELRSTTGLWRLLALAKACAIRRRSDARCAASHRKPRDTAPGPCGGVMPPRLSANEGGVLAKLGQTSTNFKVKRGKSARNIGIDTSSSTQHRFRPGIPPSMSCKLVSSVTLFAGSRVRERVRNATRPRAASSIADCPSRCWKKRVYLLVNCKENMVCKRRRDTKGESDVY